MFSGIYVLHVSNSFYSDPVFEKCLKLYSGLENRVYGRRDPPR
jgi:hypothetical protein